MGSAFDNQPGGFLCNTQRREKALEEQCDRSRAPLSVSDLEKVIASLTLAGLKVDPFGADLSAPKPCLRNLTQGHHTYKMLGSQSGLLPSRPNVMDRQRLSLDDGEGKTGPQDLPAALTVRAIDLDAIFFSHGIFITKTKRIRQPPTTEWNKINLTFCIVMLAYSQSSMEGVKAWKRSSSSVLERASLR
jgi:hypothetical protein